MELGTVPAGQRPTVAAGTDTGGHHSPHYHYLASIETAATERELTDIEIQFKQDMSIGCDDLGKLCRAAEEIEKQRIRFCSVWQVTEEAELADEYDAWKAANPNA